MVVFLKKILNQNANTRFGSLLYLYLYLFAQNAHSRSGSLLYSLHHLHHGVLTGDFIISNSKTYNLQLITFNLKPLTYNL